MDQNNKPTENQNDEEINNLENIPIKKLKIAVIDLDKELGSHSFINGD